MPEMMIWPVSLVLARGESGVLLRKDVEGLLELLAVRKGPGLYGDRDDRLGEVHRLEEPRASPRCRRCRPLRHLHPHDDGDVAGENSSMGSDLLACMRNRRVMRSRFFLFWLYTVLAFLIVPEYILT